VLGRDYPHLVATLTVASMGSPTPASQCEQMLIRVKREIREYGYARYLRRHADNDTTAFSPEFYRTHPEVPAQLGAALERGTPREAIYLRHVEARASYELGEWLEHLGIPILVAVGGEDHVARGSGTPVRIAHELASRVPSGRMRVFQRHMMPWETTEEFVGEVWRLAVEHDPSI